MLEIRTNCRNKKRQGEQDQRESLALKAKIAVKTMVVEAIVVDEQLEPDGACQCLIHHTYRYASSLTAVIPVVILVTAFPVAKAVWSLACP